jgi:hypothetical protein
MTDNPGSGASPRAGSGSEVERLCRRAVQAAAADGGGVAVVSNGGSRGTLCATDDVATRIEEAQFVLGEGPCVDASSWRAPVLVDDLSDPSEGVQARWPGFLETATAAGVRAVYAFPLRIGAITLGAMDLYRRQPGPLTAGQTAAALLASDAIAIAMLDTARSPADGSADAWPRSAARALVHNAAGMVTIQAGVSIEEALVQLRAAAYSAGRSVDDVADDVVSGRLRFSEEKA